MKRFSISDLHSFLNTKIDRLTLVELLPKTEWKSNRATYFCLCDCGNSATLNIKTLRKKTFHSCGCYARELPKKRSKEISLKSTKHGMHNSPEYRAWSGMKQRCLNKKTRHYKDYGGRGITICDRWVKSFENFYEDVGKRPTINHSIDRIDNNGNYEPSNCRWATSKEQGKNKRKTVISTSKYRFIYHNKKLNKYVVRVYIDRNKDIYLGQFKDLDMAINKLNDFLQKSTFV